MAEEKSIKIDSKDKMIISLLESNPKISHQKIADKLNMARQTIQKRIKDLEENEVIRYSLSKNYKKLGIGITAFILIEFGRVRRGYGGFHQELVSRMKELDILEFHHVAGEDDTILKIKTQNIDSLEAIIIKISEMKGVARTRTLICLSSIEESVQEIDTNFQAD